MTEQSIVLMDYTPIVNGKAMLNACVELGTKDSYGLERLRIVRGSGWTDMEVLAVFHAPDGTATKVIVEADGALAVPPEATAEQAGRGKIVFVGMTDGAQRITVDLAYTIRDHAGIEGDNPGTPTPDVVQQILENSNHAVSIATAAQDAAENAHRAAEDAAKKAGEEAGGAAASAAAAEKSAESAAESSEAAADAASDAAEDAKAAQMAQGGAESAAQSAAASATAAANSASSIAGAQEATAASAAAAKKSAEDAEAAAKAAGDAATKVIEEGVAEKLQQMQDIQTDVTERQADVTEKQQQVNASVELAQQAAAHNGYMQMGVDPDTGHLLYTRTTNLKDMVDFAIVNDTNLEVHIHG